jgi:hypothetical protein
MYYRLFDSQTGRYMSTGNNATSINRLIDEYKSYKELGWTNKDIKRFNSFSKKDKVKQIESDEFIIEKSNKKFVEIDD